MPHIQQRQCPALLNGLAQVQLAHGQAEAAFATFQVVAGYLTVPRARAEARYNAYQAALAMSDWTGALATLQQAVADDSERWSPFPLAKYEPQKILGAGGFGVVFLCHHRNLGTLVVLKALVPEELKRGIAEVFAEASLLEELDHPALIRVRDGDFAAAGEERPFLVLEYFDALDLQHYVEQQGPLTRADLLAVACPLAEALHLAHRRNILHRDIKPANLLLRREETGWRIRLIDFGLAQRSQAEAQTAQATVGTIDYSAPEQLRRRHEPTGPYSDVYAFARLCCFALFKTPQPLRKHWQQLPDSLADLLDCCLAEAPAERPQHFGEILPRLYRLRDELGGTASAAYPCIALPLAPPLPYKAQPPAPPTTESADPPLPESLGVKDLQRMINQMLEQVQRSPRRAVDPDASLMSIRANDERQVVRQLLDHCRALPDDQRRHAPALLNAIGKLEVATGDFDAAQKTFEEVASLASRSPEADAEARFNVYRVALERADWVGALRELQEACRLSPGRFAPFPLDVFEPQRVLGMTASGVKFLCQQRRLNRPVVVKTLPHTLGAAEVSRLFRECQLLAPLEEPALLRIQGCGYADPVRKERPYVVQEYFEGLSLWAFVNRDGVLNVPNLLAVAKPMALALQACHNVGVLHGNLTPEALLLRKLPTGWMVKVADVGIRYCTLVPTHTFSLTRRNHTFVGQSFDANFAYVASEVKSGAIAQPLADVYSFGRTCCYAWILIMASLHRAYLK